MTTVRGLRYFYQVDLNGDPIQGSNTRLKRRPLVNGKGRRWVEYIPKNEAYPCCPSGDLVITSLHTPWRYFVRLRNASVIGENPEPISGTLEKHKFKPTSYGWQEIVGVHQCAILPQFNATYAYSKNSAATQSIHLLDLLGPVPGIGDTLVETGAAIATDNARFNLNASVPGTVGITPVSAVSMTDTVTLHYTNGTCTFAFQLTIIYTKI